MYQQLVWLGAWTTRPVLLNPFPEAGPGLPASSLPPHILDGPFISSTPHNIASLPSLQLLKGHSAAGGGWWRMWHKLTQMAESAWQGLPQDGTKGGEGPTPWQDGMGTQRWQ